MKNENSTAKFEIGSSGVFRLLTPRVYIDGAASGTAKMFALGKSDGTTYALKYTADGTLEIKGTIYATNFYLGDNEITTTNGKIDSDCLNIDTSGFSINGISSNYIWNNTNYEVAITSGGSMLIGANGNQTGGIIVARDGSSVAAEINKNRICL